MPALATRPRFAPIAFCALLAACATPSGIADSSGALHRGATTAEAQTALLFRATNSQARAVDVERKLLEGEVNAGQGLQRLSEKDFLTLIPPEVAGQWSSVFAAITGYTGALVQMGDPVLGGGVGNALQGTGQSINGLAGRPLVSGPVSGAIAAFGSAVVQAAAEKKAADVIRRTDPAFNDLLQAMADALGADDRSGLRGTVADSWNSGTLVALSTRYTSITATTPQDVAQRRELVRRYADALDSRDRQLADIASLRASLLALAAAHRAAASAKPADANAWIGRVTALADDFSRRAGR